MRVNPFGLVLPAGGRPGPGGARDRPLRRQLRPPPQPRRRALARARDHARGACQRHPEARLRIVGTAPPPRGPRAGRAARRGGRRRAQRRAPPGGGGGRAGAGAHRGRDADEGAAGDGGGQGGGDDDARRRGLHRASARSRRWSVADGDEEIAAATAALLGDAAAPAGARARGRAEFAERHHSPEAWAERLDGRLRGGAREPAGGRAWLSAPLVSVIIPTHQRREPLRRALESLARADGPERLLRGDRLDRRLDRRHRGDAGDLRRALRAAHGSRRTMRGRAAACNAAIAAAGGEVPDRPRRRHGGRRRSSSSATAATTRPDSRLCVLGAVPVELERREPPRGALREGQVRPPPRAARRSPSTSTCRAPSTPATPRCGPS